MMNQLQLQPLHNVPPRVIRGINATPVGPCVGGVEQIGGNSVCWTGGSLDEHNVKRTIVTSKLCGVSFLGFISSPQN